MYVVLSFKTVQNEDTPLVTYESCSLLPYGMCVYLNKADVHTYCVGYSCTLSTKSTSIKIRMTTRFRKISSAILYDATPGQHTKLDTTDS